MRALDAAAAAAAAANPRIVLLLVHGIKVRHSGVPRSGEPGIHNPSVGECAHT